MAAVRISAAGISVAAQPTLPAEGWAEPALQVAAPGSAAVISTAAHFREISRQEKQEPDREQKIVDEADHCSSGSGVVRWLMMSTSVAP